MSHSAGVTARLEQARERARLRADATGVDQGERRPRRELVIIEQPRDRHPWTPAPNRGFTGPYLHARAAPMAAARNLHNDTNVHRVQGAMGVSFTQGGVTLPPVLNAPLDRILASNDRIMKAWVIANERYDHMFGEFDAFDSMAPPSALDRALAETTFTVTRMLVIALDAEREAQLVIVTPDNLAQFAHTAHAVVAAEVEFGARRYAPGAVVEAVLQCTPPYLEARVMKQMVSFDRDGAPHYTITMIAPMPANTEQARALARRVMAFDYSAGKTTAPSSAGRWDVEPMLLRWVAMHVNVHPTLLQQMRRVALEIAADAFISLSALRFPADAFERVYNLIFEEGVTKAWPEPLTAQRRSMSDAYRSLHEAYYTTAGAGARAPLSIEEDIVQERLSTFPCGEALVPYADPVAEGLAREPPGPAESRGTKRSADDGDGDADGGAPAQRAAKRVKT
jgi:hypothetical protein